MPPHTLAILAGGAGSRMGQPKALLRIGGQPILAYLLDRFAWPGPTLLVTSPGRQRPPAADRFTREVTDPVPGQGPLRGILTALEHATTDLLIITTVDMPGLTSEHLHELLAMHSPTDAGILLERIAGNDRVLEPFPCLLSRLLCDAVSVMLNQGNASVRSLARLPGIKIIPRDWPPSAWQNLNHPQDLSAFETRETDQSPPPA